jgi:hypothetical protein
MEPTAGELIATIGVLGVIIKAIVDAVRRKYPTMDGLWVQVVAFVLGGGVAFAFDVQATRAILDFIGASAARTPVPALDYVITGAAIAAGAGLLAELSGRSGGPTPVIVEVNASGEPL